MSYKKPKTVEIGETATEKEYKRFFQYGVNSSTWYATTYNRTVSETRDRLKKKGYPDDTTEVTIEKTKEIETHHILDEVIAELEKLHILDDEKIVADGLYFAFMNNKSLSQTIRNLKLRGIDEELIDDEYEKLSEQFDKSAQEDSEYEGIERIASRIVCNNAFLKLDKWKRKNKVLTSLSRKGYDFSAIQDWISENPEHFDVD